MTFFSTALPGTHPSLQQDRTAITIPISPFSREGHWWLGIESDLPESLTRPLEPELAPEPRPGTRPVLFLPHLTVSSGPPPVGLGAEGMMEAGSIP